MAQVSHAISSTVLLFKNVNHITLAITKAYACFLSIPFQVRVTAEVESSFKKTLLCPFLQAISRAHKAPQISVTIIEQMPRLTTKPRRN